LNPDDLMRHRFPWEERAPLAEREIEEPSMDVHEWLEIGQREGHCSKIVCATHDGLPTTDEEEGEMEGGFDPCLFAVRILEA
jgi:hypothetical protein